MQTLYTAEVREYIQTRGWPKGLVMDVYESDDPGPHLNFVFYRDNFIKFDTEQQAKIAAVIKELMEKLRKDGIPCYMGKMAHVSSR